MARALLLLLLVLPQDDGSRWVYFDSRETKSPPRLVVDGKVFDATADTVLISYLADRPFGSMQQLSISLGDTNRALLRFDFDGKAAQAELVLSLRMSAMPPAGGFELGVYALKNGFDERSTTWKSQPAAEDEPAATAKIEPKSGDVRIDVTSLAKRWPKHGVLLRVTKPLGGDPGAADALNRDLLAMFPWAKSAADAVARAKERDRRVLALVAADSDPARLPLAESLLLCALAHPDLRALVDARFVPVRLSYASTQYIRGGGRDPLEPLGTRIADAKAPALVVAGGDGRHVATLESIGTYDVERLHAFLRGALPPSKETDAWKLLAAGDLDAAEKAFRTDARGLARVAALRGKHEAAVELAKDDPLVRGASLTRLGRPDDARQSLEQAAGPEAAYRLGCLLWRDREKALAHWKKIPKDSPWALPAAIRIAWPERAAIYDPVQKQSRAVDYLVASQLADGSWPVAEGDMYKCAVTALAARALFANDGDKTAIARATEWLGAYAARADPATASSWGTAYLLEYVLDRHAADKSFKGAVEKAIALHLGGQCPNGAWSYDRGFGTRWRGGFGGWPKTDKGRVHSMNTGPAVIALARAKKAGFPVDADALGKAKDALLAMRDEPGVWTYTYPDPRCFNKPDQSIGRASGCEHALLLLGAATEKDADATLALFMEHRDGLRAPVKLTAAWVGPKASSNYFYAFAYYHAAALMKERGAADSLAKLRDDLLATVEPDGTWVDFHEVGKPYATAMALLVLRLAEKR